MPTQSAPSSVPFSHRQHDFYHFFGSSLHRQCPQLTPPLARSSSNGRYSRNARSRRAPQKATSPHPLAHDLHAREPLIKFTIHGYHSSIKPSFLSLLWHLSWVLRPAEAPNTRLPFLDLCEHKAGSCFEKHAAQKTSSSESRECSVLHLCMAAPHSHCSAAAVRWQPQQPSQTPFAR